MAIPTNTLLVEGSFSELAEELAQYLDTLNKTESGSGVAADVESLLSQIREAESQETQDDTAAQKQKDDVLKKIITKATVLNNAPEREFTAAYNLLINLAAQSQIRDQLLARLCQYLSEQPVAPNSQYGPSLAISTLTTIFNILPLVSDSRYHVFLAILKVIQNTISTLTTIFNILPLVSDSRYHVFLAILKVIQNTTSSQAFEAMIPQLEDNVPNWLSAWQLDDEDQRTLHKSIADVALAMGESDLSYKYLLNALETIPSGSASDADSQKLAKETLITALSNPSVTDFTPLTASEAIQNLRKSDSNLFELLEIFSSDDYSSYTDFLETNTLSSVGIPDESSEVLSTKIRLLTLAGIAASAPNRSVPYSAISSALQVPSEDVEMWVIDSIRAGLVEGKLSQLKQEFLVQRATYRVFGEKQWAEIQGRLMVWRRSLESVLSAVRTERERFLREGANAGEEKTNGYEGNQRRQGGRRNQQQQQPREIELSAE